MRVNWRCWPALIFSLVLSPFHWTLGAIQNFMLKRQLPLLGKSTASPLFVIGHWRCGTTLLHELLALDPNLRTPFLYECFFPNGILPAGQLTRKLLSREKAGRRSMDNMQVQLKSPGEDEIALFMLGAISPMATLAFPGSTFDFQSAMAADQTGENETRRWKSIFRRFHNLMACVHGLERTIVYKSPAHTARIKMLLEMFPKALFAYIVRHPDDVFGSMCKLYRNLVSKSSFERCHIDVAESNKQIVSNFAFMHQRFEEARPLIPDNQFHTVRFEDLIADPQGEMKLLYKELGLDGFSDASQEINAYLAKRVNHRVDKYELAKEDHTRIRDKLGAYLRLHRYEENG